MLSSDLGDLGIFWAKSIDDGAGYLPLLQHAADVTGVIETVADRLVPQGRLMWLQEQLGDADLGDVLKAAAWFHDVGKISIFFQPKVPALYSRVSAAGYGGSITPQRMRENPHSIVSAEAVSRWFKSRMPEGERVNRKSIRGWHYVVGGHHGVFSSAPGESPLSLEEPEWQGARQRFLDYGMKLIGLDEDRIVKLAQLSWNNATQALVTGILIAADWVGSSETFFPYDDLPSDQRLLRALERLDLGGVWVPDGVDESTFGRRFNFPASAQIRNVQRAAIAAAETQDMPSFTLIENETGAGKTEAALAMAEIIAKRQELNGVFFAQPTRVTSDAMFARVAQWLRSGDSSGQPISTILAHGKAEFSEDFRSLSDAMPREIYDDDAWGAGETTALEATRWFRGRKTNLLASAVVGTIDQLLFGALQSKHLVLRHLGLVGKVVVIDEIHAADDYMREYLTRILEWLGYYGVPVIALSATLPTAQRNQLVSAYYEGATGFTSSSPDMPTETSYPRITVVNKNGVQASFPAPDGDQRRTRVEFLEGDIDELAEAVEQAARNGGCIAVICSTINRAQMVYELLRESQCPVELLHSRFVADHRAEKERVLVEQLGKDGAKRPHSLIVVSTQIIEQGLDLDFDLMFSDIAPLDLLIQRMGRLHRHKVLNPLRPEKMSEPRFIVVGAGKPDESGAAPKLPRGLIAVYRSAPLLRSALVLSRHLQQENNTVTSPNDVASLVNSAYDSMLEPPESWRQVWEKAEEKDVNFRTDQMERAHTYRIPSGTEAKLERWNQVSGVADEQQGVAQVRDADESFEVIVVTRRNGGLYALPRVAELADIPLEGMLSMDWEVARTLARSTVRLPSWVVSDKALAEMENDGDPSWQESPWLSGQLPLVLDENLQRVLDKHLLSYDEEFGLLIEKYEEKGGGEDDEF